MRDPSVLFSLSFSEEVLLGHRKEIRLDMGGMLISPDGLLVITEDPDGKKYILKLAEEPRNVYTGITNVLLIHKTFQFFKF